MKISRLPLRHNKPLYITCKIIKNIISFFKEFIGTEWSQKKLHSISFLIAIYAVFFLIGDIFPTIKLTDVWFYLALFITGIIPACILFIYINGIKFIKAIGNSFWGKFAYASILAIYITYAHSWSEKTVNEVMRYSPKLFQYTTQLLTLEFFHVAILNPISQIAMAIYIIGITFLTLVGALYPLIPSNIRKKIFLFAIKFLVFVVLMQIANAHIAVFYKNKNMIIKKIAVEWDFNDKTSCMTNDKANRIGIMRINDDKILEAFPDPLLNYKITPSECPS